MKKRIMFIGAHQDDMQGAAAGLFAKLQKALPYEGLEVTLTDGSVGHYLPTYGKHPKRLTDIRVKESTKAAKTLGFDYQLLTDINGNTFPDGDLQITRATKGAVWAAIRNFQPDLLITLPVNDISDSFGMHNDHTNVGEIVKRIAYLIPAPFAFREYYSSQQLETVDDNAPVPYIKPPIIVTTHDGYSGQIDPDLVIDISDTIDVKVESYAKHVSQVQEWLPWIGCTSVPQGLDDLRERLLTNSNRLIRKLNLPKGIYEAFTITAWGAIPTIEDIKTFFPGDVFDYQLAHKKITEQFQ